MRPGRPDGTNAGGNKTETLGGQRCCPLPENRSAAAEPRAYGDGLFHFTPKNDKHELYHKALH